MIEAPTVRVTPLRNSDSSFAASLADVDSILMRAYNMPSRQSRIERYLAIDELGFVVAYLDDVLVGCGGVVAYPSGGFGWIGLIATDPDHAGRGVGRAITNHLVGYLRSIDCVAVLDGSDSGAPLYEKMGFIDHGVTAQYNYTGPIATHFTLAPGCSLATQADFEEIVAFDTPRFGADRSPLLRYLWRENSQRWVTVRGPSGELSGYGTAADTTIGPIVSNSIDATHALLTTLTTFSFDRLPWINVPPESSFHGPIRDRDDFTLGRSLRHQRLGAGTLPGDRDCLVAQCSFGEG